jgi:hypothetical protein
MSVRPPVGDQRESWGQRREPENRGHSRDNSRDYGSNGSGFAFDNGFNASNNQSALEPNYPAPGW